MTQRTSKYRLKQLRWLIMVLLTAFVFTSCASSTEEMSLFRRKIMRVDMTTQKADTYSKDTTISQLISSETRSSAYNFSENTKIAYETTFLTVPATLVYSFSAGGTLSSVEFFFDFASDTAEQDVQNVYDECMKFFGYPDEGYTQDIYSALNTNPKVVWDKNNAEITLSYSVDENLDTHAVLSYYESSYSGTSVAVFKLPFCESALGDGILSVVSGETKNNSESTSSIVEYVYKPADTVLLSARHVFKGSSLKRIEMTLFSPNESARGMKSLNGEIIQYMDEQYADAFRSDKSDNKAFDVSWSGEAMAVSLYSTKDSGNRQTLVTITFGDYLN